MLNGAQEPKFATIKDTVVVTPGTLWSCSSGQSTDWLMPGPPDLNRIDSRLRIVGIAAAVGGEDILTTPPGLWKAVDSNQ